MRAPAAVPALSLALGSALGLMADGRLPPWAGWLGLSISVAAAWLALRRSAATTLVIAVATGCTAAGALLASDAWRHAARSSLRVAVESIASTRTGSTIEQALDAGVFVELTGVLREDAAIRAEGVSLRVDVTAVRPLDLGERASRRTDAPVLVQGGVLLSVGGELARDHVAEWRAARQVTIAAQLRRPSRYLNPGVPDQERQLARRGVSLVGSVKSGALVHVVRSGSWASERAARIRRGIRRAVANSVGPWSSRSAAIVTAVLIGDRAGLDEVVERRLQDAGTYHVIAISGGNIAILAGLALWMFRVAGALGATAMVTAAGALAAYCLVVGPAGGESVLRATLMAILYLVGRAIDLGGSSGNTLAITAALLLAADPLAVADPGFLLTVGATTAIVLAVGRVPDGARGMVRAARLLFISSLAAEVALLPVSACVFSRVTLAGLLLNFLAIPLMSLVQVTGIAAVAVSFLSPAAALLVGWLSHQSAFWLVSSAQLVEWVPVLAWRVAPPAPVVIAIYYMAAIAAWIGWRHPRGLGRVALGCAVAAGLWIATAPWTIAAGFGNGRLRVTFMDVGQGDAALIRFPRGRTLLIDAGGLPASTFDIGDRIVAPVLRHAGVRRLDVAAMTHAHPDHVGGLAVLLLEFRPREVWDGVPVPRLPTRTALRETAHIVHARWTTLQRGDSMEIDGVAVLVHHPPLPDWERQEVRNDDSLVIELRHGDVSFVFGGDIGREVERDIAGRFRPSRVRVMTAPHHGSLTSSDARFVEALSPRVVVMSAGRGNSFGHPAPEVVERYRQAGVDVFRTDRDGAVVVETDGTTLTLATHGGRAATY